MGQVREELNIGQLCKERFGEEARLIGFGTHTGTVACGDGLGRSDGSEGGAAFACRKL
jgi:erythromycin esterase-like protein